MTAPEGEPPAPEPRRTPFGASHRIVENLRRAASGAIFEMTPYDPDDLVLCMAALGVDSDIQHQGNDPAVLRHVVRSLARLSQDIVRCFSHRGRAVLPDTACALLLHLTSRVAESQGVSLPLVAELAVAKLRPAIDQDGATVVRLVREMRQDRIRRDQDPGAAS